METQLDLPQALLLEYLDLLELAVVVEVAQLLLLQEPLTLLLEMVALELSAAAEEERILRVRPTAVRAPQERAATVLVTLVERAFLLRLLE